VPSSLYKLAFGFGLAGIVPASSLETRSVALTLKCFDYGFFVVHSWLLHPPETPSRLLPSVA
jgi:hypothetical protein